MKFVGVGMNAAEGLSGRKLMSLAGTRTGVLAITSVGSMVIRTVSSVVLTRLLRPDDFGIVGLIGSVFFTAAMFTDLGFQAFLMRHELTDDPHFRNVIWTIHAKRGVGLFILLAVTAPLIAGLFGKPAITLPLAVAAATLAIDGFTSLSLSTAPRDDKARELSILELGLQIFQSCCAIMFAFLLRNVWSMIIAMLLQTTARTFLSFKLFDRSSQSWETDSRIFLEFIKFSRLILASSIITLLLAQSDKLVLARLFTLRDFGLYALALNITGAPRGFAQAYISRVVFPVYAATWRECPDRLANVYYNVRKVQSRLYALGCGGLMGGATLVVSMLYDSRYSMASSYISILMISVAFQLPNLAATELLTATGNLKPLVRVNAIRLLWLAVSIPIGFYLFGTIGVVFAVGLLEVPPTIYNWILLRTANVLSLKEEFLSVGLLVGGAGIGRVIALWGLKIIPYAASYI